MSLSLLLAGSQAFGQQSYVGRFDVFAGYAYLNSPHISLAENGFHLQGGVRAVRWLSLGLDYSRATGDAVITPDLLLPSLQQGLGAQLKALAAAGRLPSGYTLSVPISSVTQTFAAGPQVGFHHWAHLSPFIRPSVGIIHEVATPMPGDPIAAGVVKQLAPAGTKTDKVLFYGVGGGVDLQISKHLALRVQADFVHDHLFDDLLKDGRNTVRFSIGPTLQFGKNVDR